MDTLGIDIGATNIKAGLVRDGKIIARQSLATGAPESIIGKIIELHKTLGGESIGIGIAGLVRGGVLLSSPNLPGYKNVKIKSIIEKERGVKVIVENDANMAALGEYKYGAGRGVNNLVLITLGTGVGGGIIIQGKLYKGLDFAGEIGHMIVKPDGPLCRCGNRGCLETFCGSSYLIERARFGIRNGRKTSLKEPITPKTIETEARRGDSLSLSIVNEMGYYLGIGITSIYAVLDPDRIVIAGGMAPMTDLLIKFITPVTKRIYTKRDIDVRRSELGDDAGILGASLCVIQS